MFLTIEADRYHAYQHLLFHMHKTRKVVFHDRLQWDVPVTGDVEIDKYDRLGPVYLIWCDASAKQFIGSMRLLPTTGPTLLDEVFRATYPSNVSLSAPSIWEVTRTCVDDAALALHHPEKTPAMAFGMIMLAVCEWCLLHGVETIVTNYEPYLARIYRRAGVEVVEIGRAEGYGRYPVCCGMVEISCKLLARMRRALDVTAPLLTGSVAGIEGYAA